MALLASALGCGGEAGSGSNSEGGITDSWSGDAPTIGEGASDGVVMDSPSGDAGTGDGSSDGAARGCPITDAGLEDGGPTRVPMNHRPAGSACPQQRAAISPEASTCTPPDSSSCGACTKDSDCTQGTNGRCGYDGPAAYLVCSYDG